MTQLFEIGKWLSKHQTSREIISLNYLMMTIFLSSLFTQRMICSLNLLDTQNFLYVRVTRAITNYASIGEYCLRFFPKKNFCSLCGYYPIELRHYILHKCRRYNNYWNPNRYYIPNSETCPRHVGLQYNIKFPWLFHFIWVKIHSHLYLFSLYNYLLQTPQNYLDFM